MTYSLLEKAPKNHHSPEFLQFLRDNNTVVFENDYWLFIENCKYNNQDGNKRWHTAFLKSNQGWFIMQDAHYHALKSAMIMSDLDYTQWEMRIKAPKNRSVGRYHVHFIEN